MTANPKVAVISVSWNSAEHTVECVKSLLRSSYDNFTINIIDNGSKHSDLAILDAIKSEKVRIHRLDKNYGYVGGVNRGLKIAEKQKPDYYLVLNNDVVVDSEALQELVMAAQRHDNQCIVTGIVYDYYQKDLIQQIGAVFQDKKNLTFKSVCSNQRDPGFIDTDLEMDAIDDVFWLLPHAVFKFVGFYSDDFWFNNEQADYALRAVKAGNKLIFTPKAKIWHKGSVSIGGKDNNPVREYYDTKSRLIFRYKHMKKSTFCAYYFNIMFVILYGTIKQSIVAALKRDSRLNVQIAKVLGFVDFHKWFMLRNPDQGNVPRVLKRWT